MDKLKANDLLNLCELRSWGQKRKPDEFNIKTVTLRPDKASVGKDKISGYECAVLFLPWDCLRPSGKVDSNTPPLELFLAAEKGEKNPNNDSVEIMLSIAVRVRILSKPDTIAWMVRGITNDDQINSFIDGFKKEGFQALGGFLHKILTDAGNVVDQVTTLDPNKNMPHFVEKLKEFFTLEKNLLGLK